MGANFSLLRSEVGDGGDAVISESAQRILEAVRLAKEITGSK